MKFDDFDAGYTTALLVVSLVFAVFPPNGRWDVASSCFVGWCIFMLFKKVFDL